MPRRRLLLLLSRWAAGMSRVQGSVRIIGGAWRSRRIRFPSQVGVRPTPDRVRETLFNWLGTSVEGTRVLDLFAGSGALGFEALSRGAAQVDFVERRGANVKALRENIALLRTEDRASVYCEEALSWLRSAAGPYNVVFLDPPYDSDLVDSALIALSRPGLLAPDHRVYLERRPGASVPGGWKVHRVTRAGMVEAALVSLVSA